MDITDVVNFFTIAGALSTIIAMIVAFLAYKNWKIQQEYSFLLNLLFDAEDKFIMYITRNIEDFNAFWQASKYIREHKNEDNRKVNETIEKHFSISLNKELTEKIIFEFDLSVIRLARMIPDVEEIHKDIKNKIVTIQKEYIKEPGDEERLSLYLEEIMAIRSHFISILTSYRKNKGKNR